MSTEDDINTIMLDDEPEPSIANSTTVTNNTTTKQPARKDPVLPRRQKLPKKKQKPENPAPAMPEFIKNKFVAVHNKYYDPEQTETPAFTDHGNKLQTDLTNTSLTKTLVAIAQARNWNKIKVQGNKTFKRDTWLQASTLGIQVAGYEPSELDLAELKRRTQKPEQPKSTTQDQTQTNNQNNDHNKTSGILIEHGKQHYKYDPQNTKSYVVKIQDEQGQIHTKWGIELGKEMKDKNPKIGEKIDLIYQGKVPVAVQKPIRDEKGQIVGQTTIDTHRNKWEVQTEKNKALAEEFAKGRHNPEALAQKQPTLQNAAATIAVAQKFADEKIQDKTAQKQFTRSVSKKIEHDIASGNTISPIKAQEYIKTKEVEPDLER